VDVGAVGLMEATKGATEVSKLQGPKTALAKWDHPTRVPPPKANRLSH